MALDRGPHGHVACFGEVLWDVLPSGTFLGGAPLNVAAHLARLGCRSHLISRVGADSLGTEARARIRALGVDDANLQQDDLLPTGEARATLDASGAARYTFVTPAAWDAIQFDAAAAQCIAGASMLVFGSLAQRDARSAAALESCIAEAPYRVFDVNLRQPHCDAQVVLRSLREADLVKLNEEECAIVGGWLGTSPDPISLLRSIRGIRDSNRPHHSLQLCITRGAEGAVLWADGQWHEQQSLPTRVIDTVGAGDSFLSMLLAQQLHGASPPVALQRAAALAAYVASQPGAVPDYSPRQVISGW